MKLYKLDNKLTLRFKHKACEFLKGLTSNDFTAPRNAFLNVHGKIVAVFDQKIINSDEVWVIIEQQFFDRLKGHLDKYLKLSDTVLEKEDRHVYFDILGDYEPGLSEIMIPQKKGSLILTQRDLPVDISENDFTLFRLKNCIPVQGLDYDEEVLLNVGDEEFVSYTKGCYLGQEIIARIHYRGKPAKALVMKSEDECGVEQKGRLTSKVLDPATQQTLGFIFILYASMGYALE